MDISIFYFLTAFSLALFIVSRLIRGGMRAGFGWVSGGFMIVLGLVIGSGEPLTSSYTNSTGLNTLDIGFGTDYILILYLLLSIVILITSSTDL